MEINGFSFAGIHSGIKKDTSKKDLGIILCDAPVSAAGLFTKNQVKAAPVILDMELLKKGECQAVLVNSGNANCFTGEKGFQDAKECMKIVGKVFDISQDQVLVASTGVIGAPLPMKNFEAGIPQLKTHLGTSMEDLDSFSQSILTTDTFTKVVKKQVSLNGDKISIIGIAKGSGMIRPDMATMLAFVCTDANISSKDLKSALTFANEKSFSRITVDGDTSTNDTLLCMASGKIGSPLQEESLQQFQEVLTQICSELAQMVARDGEGATKLVHLRVKGALSQADALEIAQTIAHSNLVKTAVFGQDPNWGRITAAAGRSKAKIDQEKLDLFFEDVPLVLKGEWQGLDREVQAAEVMKSSEISITLDVNLANGCDEFWFCDFSEKYVSINADYRS